MLPLLRLLAFIPLVIAARLRGIERRTIARLHDAGADTAERAILLEDGGPISSFVYRRLGSAGALIAAGKDRYYWSAQGYERFRARRRRRALVMVTLLLAIIGMAYLLGYFS